MQIPSNRDVLRFAMSQFVDVASFTLHSSWSTHIPRTEANGRLIEAYSWHQFQHRGGKAGLQTIDDINQLAADTKAFLSEYFLGEAA